MNESVPVDAPCPTCHQPATWHGVRVDVGGTVYRIDCPTPACTEKETA